MNKKKLPGFVEKILENSKPPKEYEKVYYKPKKWKSVLGFIFSLIFLISLIYVFGLNVNIYFIILFIGVAVICAYYAINLFTKSGFLLPKFVEKKEEKAEEEIKDEVYYDDTSMFLEDDESDADDNT